MKKTMFIAAIAALALCSCSTVKKTATALDVQTAAESANVAELEISPNKISYEFYPTNKERRGGNKNVLNCATAAALQTNGNADILVHREYTTVTRHGLFGSSKIKKVIVSGYPAKYKSFKSK